MRQAGWLSPDQLRLGIETDEDGCLLGANGQRVTGLYTLGPLRRPALWESTAIPEIREQAAAWLVYWDLRRDADSSGVIPSVERGIWAAVFPTIHRPDPSLRSG